MAISESEKLIMDILWSESPLTAAQIIERLDTSLQWNDKTVKTLINRLLNKNAIAFEKHGREYWYTPTLKQQSYIHSASRKFLQNFFDGSISSLVANFAQQEKLDPAEISELKALLQTLESGDADKEPAQNAPSAKEAK